MTLKGWIGSGFIVASVLMGCRSLPVVEDNLVVPTAAPPLVVINNPTATTTTIPSATIAPITSPEPIATATAAPTFTVMVAPATSEPSPIPEEEQYRRAELPSPDGQWMAATTYTRLNSGFPLEVTFTLTNSQTNDVIMMEILGVEAGSRWVEEVPIPVAWRADSQALYYTYSPGYLDGCMPHPHSTLHQYTLATNTHEILDTPAGSWYQFSPDTERVAYFPVLPADARPAVAIYTPATDTLQEITFPEFDPALAFTQDVMGQILWHPDGQRLFLSVLVAPCVREIPALLLVNTATGETTVIESGTTYHRVVEWEGDVVIMATNNGTERRYNIEAGEWVGE